MIKVKYQDRDGAEAIREFTNEADLQARRSDISNHFNSFGTDSDSLILISLQSEADAIDEALQDIRYAKLAIHKPSSFEPSDYEVVDYLDNQPPKFYPPGFMCPPHIVEQAIAMWRSQREEWLANIQRLFPNRNETGVSIHQCTHCGCRNVRYIAAVLHKPSGKNIVFGSDCVARLNFKNASDFKAAQIKARAEAGHARMRVIAARAKFISEHPELNAVFAEIDQPVHAKNHFAKDIIAKLNQYGSLSPRQVECLVQSIQRDHEYAAKKAAEALKPKAPVVAGRQEFDCVVISIKSGENDFGYFEKMLVELENGSRIYVTVPGILQGSIGRGMKLHVKCTVEASKDDPSFGFGKRPIASILSEPASV